MATVRSYRERLAGFAAMRLIDVLVLDITDDAIRAAAQPLLRGRQGRGRAGGQALEAIFAKARGRDALRAASQITKVVDGRRIVVDDPPSSNTSSPGGPDAMRKVFEDYRATMAESRREFLERYRFADFALKVVGVGNVGMRCFVFILEGRDEDDRENLQRKRRPPRSRRSTSAATAMPTTASVSSSASA